MWRISRFKNNFTLWFCWWKYFFHKEIETMSESRWLSKNIVLLFEDPFIYFALKHTWAVSRKTSQVWSTKCSIPSALPQTAAVTGGGTDCDITSHSKRERCGKKDVFLIYLNCLQLLTHHQCLAGLGFPPQTLMGSDVGLALALRRRATVTSPLAVCPSSSA